jgi:hypothetical protein
MNRTRVVSSVPRLTLLAVLASAALLPLSFQAAGQTFAVGGGAFAVNDTGAAANLTGFRNVSGAVFGEVHPDANMLVQVRVQRFTLPGTVAGAPDIPTWAGNVTIGYIFLDDWFRAGFTGGVGVYGLSPNAPQTGQTASDPHETVFGWHGGLLTIFMIDRHFDFRLEATGHLIRSATSHNPIMLGGTFAYRF